MTARKSARDARRAATEITRSVTSATTSVRKRATRRQGYSSSTRQALIDQATRLFTERGYTGTSLDEIVAKARVTKGALYHHFGSKLALFEAVFVEVQDANHRRIEKSMKKAKTPVDRINAALTTFLESCIEPTYRRIVLQEAPVALGHERWQEAEREAAFGLVSGLVADLFPDLEDDTLHDAFAHVFYGGIRAGGEWVADAEDPETAVGEMRSVAASILLGLRALDDVSFKPGE